MKRMAKLAGVLVAVFALTFALSACSGESSNYTPEKKSATVSSPAIGKDGTLRVGVNSSNAPFSAQVSGNIVGLDVDVAAALASEMGLSLEIVDVGSDPESSLADGSVDIIMNVDSTDTSVECWVSSPYVQTSVALFASSANAGMPYGSSAGNNTGSGSDASDQGSDASSQGADASAASGTPIIEAQTSSLSAWEVSSQYGEAALTNVDDLKTAFSDLSSGKADYVASDAIIGAYVCNSNGQPVNIAGIMESPSGYCVGVSKDNSDLQSAISSALSSIQKSGLVDVIQKKWLGVALDLSSYTVSSAAGSNSNANQNQADQANTEGGEAGSNAADVNNADNPDANADANGDTVVDEAVDALPDDGAPVEDSGDYVEYDETYDAGADAGTEGV